MNNANYRISLDVHDACSQVTLRARKAEDGRTIYATLTEQGRPYTISEGCSAEFVCLRPNGKKLKNECIIEGNVIRYDLTKETVITTGVAKCEFRLTDATGKLLTSPMFSLEVWSTIYTEGDAVESEIANMSTVKSANPGYSEVFMWSDGNPNNENRVGYFVGEDLERSAAMVKICNSDSNIRGVSMAAPGFASNAPGERYDENSAIRPQYCYVGLLGFAPVIDHGACAVNGRCRPGDDGTAVPDDSGGGYLVVERLDEERVLILLDPSASVRALLRRDIEDLAEPKRLEFHDTAVSAAAFVEDPEGLYDDYPRRAAIALPGVLMSMTPDVTFSVPDAVSGSFAPVAACYAGGVYIWAASVPDGTVTIPTIQCWKAVS